MLHKIVFQVGGPRFHPVDEQARQIQSWLGERFSYEMHDGIDAFDHLSDCDLLVLMGLHWTGMSKLNLEYRPMQARHKDAFENYVRSGRPIITHHGTVASYDDWPRFGELCGLTWVWGTTTHSPFGTYTVEVVDTGHPIVKDLSDFTLEDELYYDLHVTAGLNPTIHARAEWNGAKRPMIVTADGGRVEGAGKMVYLANGHDMRAFECPAMKQLWRSAVEWCLLKK